MDFSFMDDIRKERIVEKNSKVVTKLAVAKNLKVESAGYDPHTCSETEHKSAIYKPFSIALLRKPVGPDAEYIQRQWDIIDNYIRNWRDSFERRFQHAHESCTDNESAEVGVSSTPSSESSEA